MKKKSKNSFFIRISDSRAVTIPVIRIAYAIELNEL